ncbi:hypothetical protein M422DRAFT_219626 [Sphaerobolus stellatus SS14]|nr:hypothetical protein M422DRAFT_219626 [Sphaerobolus stellatus SS14]
MEITLLLRVDDSEIGVASHLDSSPSSRIINICNKRWRLSRPFDSSRDIPPYYCVSYIWGQGRTQNIIHDGFQMSDHTLPSLEAAIDNHQDITAIWIDAFCIPTDPIEKQTSLERMGYIFSQANGVIVVLKETTWEAIDEIIHTDLIAEKSVLNGFPRRLLKLIDADEWIRSIWTYQEVVNSRHLTLIGQKSQKTIMAVSFLNKFGNYLRDFALFNKLTSFDIRQTYPYVDAFEEVILDWMIPGTYSAFAVISGMYRRVCHEEANYFYSMIGIITDQPPPRSRSASISCLAESFLAVCEEQGDYSFVFCSNDRDSRPGFNWRPALEKFRPVASWSSFGEKQEGRRVPGGVILKDMHLLTKSTGAPLVNKYTRLLEQETGDEELIKKGVLERLKIMDFTGSYNYSEWEEGLFFPQQDLSEFDGDINVWVSRSIRWNFGAPGIAIVSRDNEENAFIPGVFVAFFSEVMTPLSIWGPGTEVSLTCRMTE